MRFRLRTICALVTLLALPASAETAGTEPLTEQKLENNGISITLPLPDSWRVVDEMEGTWRINAPGTVDPTVYLHVMAGDLDAAASADGLFEKREGVWYKRGRGETVRTTAISYNGWTGMYGVAVCGVSDENGFHSGGGDCLQAIVSTGSCSASLETDGLVDTEWVLQSIVPRLQIQCPGDRTMNGEHL